ncbi:putative DNA-binding domain-containing protein [Chthonobacter rhizosphaerae]|uniref:HvfC/BufC family peptide modification chaperone n=1 Tax=Chthonobacter rhizosphaerae TaxID=2735553 RepID=UPI0015EF88C6
MTSWSGRSAFAGALADPDGPVPAGILRGSSEAAQSRFAVYRNNVASGLVGALASRFPVTAAIVGDAFFRAMASRFVDGCKPTSPLLMTWGDEFPAFMETLPAAAALAYLADVARLEVAVSAAYHAAEAPPLPVPALAGIEAAALAEARLVAHPAARLLRSPHPVGSIWSAHQPGGSPADVAFRAETVLVTRPGAEIRLSLLTPAEAAFAAALLASKPLGEAAALGVAADGCFDFGQSLVAAVAGGAFTAITLKGPDP